MGAAFGGIVAGVGVLASVFWISRWVDAIRHRKTIVWLADEPAEPPEGGWPTLAVSFAARNEAGRGWSSAPSDRCSRRITRVSS